MISIFCEEKPWQRAGYGSWSSGMDALLALGYHKMVARAGVLLNVRLFRYVLAMSNHDLKEDAFENHRIAFAPLVEVLFCRFPPAELVVVCMKRKHFGPAPEYFFPKFTLVSE